MIHEHGWGLEPAAGASGGTTATITGADEGVIHQIPTDDTLREEMIQLLRSHSPPGHRDVALQCNCAHAHKDGKEGCGAWFSLNVRWEPDDEGTLHATIAPGPPLTGYELRAAEERDRLAASELTRLRAAAGSWRTGLAALLALIPTLVVVKGTDSVDGLSNDDKTTVGVLILTGVVFAVAAAICALRAAYGPLKRIELTEDDLTLAREEEINTTIKVIWATGLMTVVAVAALTAAIAYAWAAPTSTPTKFAVTLKSGDVECGTLVGSSVKGVKVKKADGTTRLIPVDQIKATTFSTAC